MCHEQNFKQNYILRNKMKTVMINETGRLIIQLKNLSGSHPPKLNFFKVLCEIKLLRTYPAIWKKITMVYLYEFPNLILPQCHPPKKGNERRLVAMETKMLRWTSGGTRFDHIRNKAIRHQYLVAPMVEKSTGLTVNVS